MDMDELRSLSVKRMDNKNRASNLIEKGVYWVCGTVTLISCFYMGWAYFAFQETETLRFEAASPTGGEREVVELEAPKILLDYSRQSGVAFAKEVINVPASVGSDGVFGKKYDACREEWKASQAQDKDMALMNFGDAMIRKQLGGRSKGLATIMVCLTDTQVSYLCNAAYREKFSKLVTKFMDSSKTSNLGMSMSQSHRKKRLARMSEDEREDFLERNELGKYDPGYIRLRKLFKAGYLRQADFKGIFFSPPWLESLSKGAGNPSRVCSA